MPEIFHPLSLSDCKILEYHTFRVAVTFGLRLELKFLEWDAFSEILLHSCVCKLLNHIFTPSHAPILQDTCSCNFGWARTQSLAVQERKRVSDTFLQLLVCYTGSVGSYWRFFFSNALFSLSHSSVYSPFLQNKRDDCTNCGVDWWTGLAGRPKGYCYAAHSDHQFGLPQKHSRVGTFGFHLGPWCTLPHVQWNN